MSGPIVVLVGRPNVGKSTLFNRLTGTRRSIVAPIAGTTRDVIEQPAEWQGRHFTLVDTGGLFGATTDPLHEMVVAHGLKALERADLIVFVVDGREGIMTGDEEIARRVRRLNVPVVLAVNKTDDKRGQAQAPSFHQLGFKEVFEISAEHGEGIGELLDATVVNAPVGADLQVRAKTDLQVRAKTDLQVRANTPADTRADAEVDVTADADETLEDVEAAEDDDRELNIAIVGRPNVGKSSLVNRLLREERMMVSDLAGTTRDAVDSVLQWQKKTVRLVDTAGMRRPGKVKEAGKIEAVSVLIAKRSMMRAEVAVLVLDAIEGATDRDAAIAGEAQDLGLGVVIAVNKWDLVKGRGQEWVKAFDDKLRYHLKFLDYAPLVHMSALTGDRTSRVLEAADRVAKARRRKVPTSQLNKFIERVTASHPPTSKGKREVRILYATQTAVEPPEFVIFTNVATELHFSYERFLMNQLREEFGFEGSPIRLKIRRREKRARE